MTKGTARAATISASSPSSQKLARETAGKNASAWGPVRSFGSAKMLLLMPFRPLETRAIMTKGLLQQYAGAQHLTQTTRAIPALFAELLRGVNKR